MTLFFISSRFYVCAASRVIADSMEVDDISALKQSHPAKLWPYAILLVTLGLCLAEDGRSGIICLPKAPRRLMPTPVSSALV
eukprot:scaffold11761_cov37-Prasinocladus_malaysianus.AAC.1